ncbi:unnamed protein product [Larinioides sclopetarius]|uniref:SOCS box domain-containing protein n=1 Tax=Larinioides sclopetarius TaxID=280406 RepID=A0AAV1YTX0_9ARAC
MDRFFHELKYRSINLDDAKSIVRHSFIVQKSVTHLDLSTCEYTSYQKQIRKMLNYAASGVSKANIQTEEDSRKFFIKERDILYIFHLDLPKNKEPSLRNLPFSHHERNLPFYKETECDSETFNVSRITVPDIWYQRNIRNLLIPFLRMTDRKMDTLIKLHHGSTSRKDKVRILGVGTLLSVCVSLNIFCCELETVGNLYGLLIVVNNHDPLTISNETNAILYQSYGNKNEVQTNVVFDNIINGLLDMRCYHILPAALNYGHVPQLNRCDIETLLNFVRCTWNYSEEQLLKGIIGGVFSIRRNALLLRTLLPLLQSEGQKAAIQAARHVLSILWRAIHDPFLSRREVEYAYKDVLEEDLFTLLNNFYQEIVEEYPLYPTPRSLKHYSRMVIRTLLKDNEFLPDGINQLDIPQELRSYLRLEF